MLTTPQCSL